MLKKVSENLDLDYLVSNYINGNDIEGYDINELENDPSFMENALRLSKDEKMYDFASESVKKDYNFCINVIEMFKVNHKFAKKVAQKYLINDGNDYLENCDVIVTLSNILRDDADDASMLYNVKAFSMFLETQIYVEELLERGNNREKYGLGFYYIENMYGTKPVVEEYFAQNMVQDLFSSDNKDRLEMLLHKKYKSVEKMEEKGLNNVLISLIESYDTYLSGYASAHLKILKNISVKVHDIINKWNYYNENRAHRKKEIVYQYISKCVEDGLCEVFNPYFILDEIASNYHLEKDLDSEPITTRDKEFNFSKEAFRKKLETLIKRLFFDDVIDEFYDDEFYDDEFYDDVKHENTKIISFKKSS